MLNWHSAPPSVLLDSARLGMQGSAPPLVRLRSLSAVQGDRWRPNALSTTGDGVLSERCMLQDSQQRYQCSTADDSWCQAQALKRDLRPWQ